MPAAPGIVTSGTGAPNAVVQIQPGMTVQPVVLVDQAGQYLATSGSAVTAGYLATQTTSVYVAGGSAPTTGQALVATGGTAATWQAVAPLASPAFTGTPTAPTGNAGDDGTQLATDAFVQSAIAAVSVPNQYGYATWTFDWYSDYIFAPAFNYTGIASGDLCLTRFLYLPVASTLLGDLDTVWHAGTGGNASTYVGVYRLTGGSAILQGNGSSNLAAQSGAAITVSTGQTAWSAGWYAFGYVAGSQATSGNAGAPWITESGPLLTPNQYLPGDTFAPLPSASYYAGTFSSLPSAVALSNFTTKTYCRMIGALR